MYERAPLPDLAGFVSFLRAPTADFGDLGPGLVAVAGVPHDSTLSTRWGARYGPRAIREGSIYTMAYLQASPEQALADIESGVRISVRQHRPIVDIGDLNVFPSDVEKTSDSLERGMYEITRSGAFPVILGGDHYITYPLFQGFARAKSETGARKIGYIQIDAHFDLVDDTKVWGKLYHGSNARRIAELESCDPHNMVWIGTTGVTFSDQLDWIRDNGAHFFSSHEVRTQGIQSIIEQAARYAGDGTDTIYVSVDIDVLDAAYAPGTGSIIVGGLKPLDLYAAMTYLRDQNVGALDLVEVNPRLDPAFRTQRIAADAIIEFLAPRVFEMESA